IQRTRGRVVVIHSVLSLDRRNTKTVRPMSHSASKLTSSPHMRAGPPFSFPAHRDGTVPVYSQGRIHLGPGHPGGILSLSASGQMPESGGLNPTNGTRGK